MTVTPPLTDTTTVTDTTAVVSTAVIGNTAVVAAPVTGIPVSTAPAIVQTPLHLVCQANSQADAQMLEQAILANIGAMQDGMNAVGTVHFAHWFFLNNNMTVILCTEYDGAFDVYIKDFIAKIGDLFNALLPHLADPPPLPVQQYPDEFIAWVAAHDVPTTGKIITAYPQLTVLDILALQQNAAATS